MHVKSQRHISYMFCSQPLDLLGFYIVVFVIHELMWYIWPNIVSLRWLCDQRIWSIRLVSMMDLYCFASFLLQTLIIIYFYKRTTNKAKIVFSLLKVMLGINVLEIYTCSSYPQYNKVVLASRLLARIF